MHNLAALLVFVSALGTVGCVSADNASAPDGTDPSLAGRIGSDAAQCSWTIDAGKYPQNSLSLVCDAFKRIDPTGNGEGKVQLSDAECLIAVVSANGVTPAERRLFRGFADCEDVMVPMHYCESYLQNSKWASPGTYGSRTKEARSRMCGFVNGGCKSLLVAAAEVEDPPLPSGLSYSTADPDLADDFQYQEPVQGKELQDSIFVGALASAQDLGFFTIGADMADEYVWNSDGTLTITFHEMVGGKHETVAIIVDLDVPMRGGDVAYAHGRNDGVWPALYEKAYAQWKGSYAAIERAGSMEDVLFAITGSEGETIPVSSGTNPDSLFEKLKAARLGEAKHPVLAMAGASGSRVVAGRAYPILSTAEIANKETKIVERFIELRDTSGTCAPCEGKLSILYEEFLPLFKEIVVLTAS